MASAEDMLETLIEQYRFSSYNKMLEWAKIHAYGMEKEANVGKEADAMLEELHLKTRAFIKAPSYDDEVAHHITLRQGQGTN